MKTFTAARLEAEAALNTLHSFFNDHVLDAVNVAENVNADAVAHMANALATEPNGDHADLESDIETSEDLWNEWEDASSTFEQALADLEGALDTVGELDLP